ncbi:MAG: PspC domain-containing protein [Aeromicrobium erythreum]
MIDVEPGESSTATPPQAGAGRRRAVRPADRRVLGGVAAGVAEHLGVPVVGVRAAFVVATWFNGAGVLAYLLLWRFLPLAEPVSSPGVEAATRGGLRPPVRTGARDVLQTAAVVALGVGVLVLLQVVGVGPSDRLVVPAAVGLVGIAVVWRQLDDAAMRRWMRGTNGWALAGRVGAGVALVALAGLYLVTQERGWNALVDLASATVVALVGIALLLGPWIVRLVTDLGRERRERIRSQERADVAAHLHDSVLQTLALLQKNAGDQATVATLARRQERELRAWLYGDEQTDGDTWATALRAVAAEVEQTHQVAVEVVVVGDAPLDADLAALVRAAREALVNAARHAGVDRVDVYGETDGRQVEVFVRDRGAGFDPTDVPEDRMGVRGSIVGRVERHGGTATVRSAPGEGTEVALRMPVRAVPPPQAPVPDQERA